MLGRAAATACCVGLLVGAGFAQAASADGSFESSDSLVNLIWRNSVQTAGDMVSPPVGLDRRGCDIGLSTILLDGAQRDRCPYIGDQAVTGMTLLSRATTSASPTYNAQYVRALRQAASLADWAGEGSRADRWENRADATAAAASTFWDGRVGAFRDTAAGNDVHPLDANAFAILAGLASPAQADSALAYVDRTMKQSYGNSIADVSGWRGWNWDDDDELRVYPFISYFEVLARYSVGADASALELIRRESGYMATRRQGTMWEKIELTPPDPFDSVPSYDHGWSSGAAPALTTYVLGVQPTSPGFATFTVTPHPGGLTFARGTVPTPRGPIGVSWSVAGGKLSLQVTAPDGAVWENAPARQAAPTPSTGVVTSEELTKSPGSTATTTAGSSTAATRRGRHARARARRGLVCRQRMVTVRARRGARGRRRGDALVVRGPRRRRPLA